MLPSVAPTMPRIYTLTETKPRRRDLRQRSTQAERKLWAELRDGRFFGYKFRRQHGIGPYIVDFFCHELRLVIEVDGDSHFMDGAAEYDRVRQRWLENLNLRVVRFTNDDVLKNLDEVLNSLKALFPSSLSTSVERDRVR